MGVDEGNLLVMGVERFILTSSSSIYGVETNRAPFPYRSRNPHLSVFLLRFVK